MVATPADWIVILSPPRSYSTVVTAMLGCHPEMYAFPEFHAISFPTIGDLLLENKRIEAATGISMGYLAGVIRSVIDLEGLQNHRSPLLSALEWLKERADWKNHELLAWIRKEIYPRTGVIKSTLIGQDPMALQQLRANVPGARFIYLTRHPIAIIKSQLNMSLKNQWNLSEYAPFTAHSLLYHHKFIRSFLESIPVTEWVQVRGEDVVSDPSILPNIADYMGRRSDRKAVEAMRHPEKWRFAQIGLTPHEAEGDVTFFSDPRLRPPSPLPMEIPLQWGIERELQANLAALAHQQGYR